MPSQNRVGCDDRCDLRQHPTAQPLPQGSQPPPVMIRQPQTPMAQLRLQRSVLFAQVQDDLVLFLLEPAEKGRDEELHRNHGAESTPIAGPGFRTLTRSAEGEAQRRGHGGITPSLCTYRRISKP